MTVAALGRENRITTPLDPIVFESTPHRYHDPRFNAIAVKVLGGDYYVTDADEMLVTVLGSCVSACIRDPATGVGGMNHFMLPDSIGSDWNEISPSMRYGNVAMERLINDILARGALRRRLEVKVFGGGNVMRGRSDIGHRNADFVENYLQSEGLPIAAADLRGTLPRRVHYFPLTGRVMVLELQRASDMVVVDAEARYRSKLQSDPIAGTVELF